MSESFDPSSPSPPRKRSPRPLSLEVLPSPPPGFPRSLTQALVEEQLQDLITTLPLTERQKEIAILKVVCKYPLRDIARIIGIRRQNVEKQWVKIKKKLSKGLRALEEEIPPGACPYYGWQEVFLQTLKRRGKR